MEFEVKDSEVFIQQFAHFYIHFGILSKEGEEEKKQTSGLESTGEKTQEI